MSKIINTKVYNENARMAIDAGFYAGSVDALIRDIENNAEAATNFLADRVGMYKNDTIHVEVTETEAKEVMKPVSGADFLVPTLEPDRSTKQVVEQWVFQWTGKTFKQLAHERKS